MSGSDNKAEQAVLKALAQGGIPAKLKAAMAKVVELRRKRSALTEAEAQALAQALMTLSEAQAAMAHKK